MVNSGSERAAVAVESAVFDFVARQVVGLATQIAREPCSRAIPQIAARSTEKLSPQPHSPATFGFLNTKMRFRP